MKKRNRNRSYRWRKHMACLMGEQGNRCYYCNREVSLELDKSHESRATLDHKIPRSRGGANARENLVVACNGCNRDKADLTEEEFGLVYVRQLKKRSKTPNPFEQLKYMFALGRLMIGRKDADA